MIGLYGQSNSSNCGVLEFIYEGHFPIGSLFKLYFSYILAPVDVDKISTDKVRRAVPRQ